MMKRDRKEATKVCFSSFDVWVKYRVGLEDLLYRKEKGQSGKILIYGLPENSSLRKTEWGVGVGVGNESSDTYHTLILCLE